MKFHIPCIKKNLLIIGIVSKERGREGKGERLYTQTTQTGSWILSESASKYCSVAIFAIGV